MSSSQRAESSDLMENRADGGEQRDRFSVIFPGIQDEFSRIVARYSGHRGVGRLAMDLACG
jgi:hypothetical protein